MTDLSWQVTRKHPWRKINHNIPRRYRARGRVWRDKKGLWHLEVKVGDTVVLTDNTRHWRTIFDQCNEAVWAFDYVSWVGHRFGAYNDL